MNFPQAIKVTEQEIDISHLSQQQKDFHLKLFEELTHIYADQKKDRVVVGMAGPTGAGKSFTASILKEIAGQANQVFQFEHVTIDAFHFRNEKLASDFINGEALLPYKGRFDTYDVDKLVVALTQFAEGNEVFLPTYSRKLHEPVENTIHITDKKSLLLVEGLWLLSDTAGWNKIKGLLDFSFFVDADKEKTREFVIKRHMNGGKTIEQARLHYDAVDSKNFDLVMLDKSKADKILPAFNSL